MHDICITLACHGSQIRMETPTRESSKEHSDIINASFHCFTQKYRCKTRQDYLQKQKRKGVKRRYIVL